MPLGPPEPVTRFSGTERLLHWAFALGYLALLVTGLPLMVPALRGAIRGYAPTIGTRLHLLAAACWVIATVAVVLFGDRGRLRATWRDMTRFTSDDWRWLGAFPRWLLGSGAARARIDAAVGRFNAGQKLNLVFTLLTSLLLLVSGAAVLPLPGGGVTVADLVSGPESRRAWLAAHRWCTMLVLVPVAGHVFLATVHRATRPSLGGMLAGHVDRSWAAAHHPRWRAHGTEDSR
jgi:formate dehydrogenase subunit gamma